MQSLRQCVQHESMYEEPTGTTTSLDALHTYTHTHNRPSSIHTAIMHHRLFNVAHTSSTSVCDGAIGSKPATVIGEMHDIQEREVVATSGPLCLLALRGLQHKRDTGTTLIFDTSTKREYTIVIKASISRYRGAQVARCDTRIGHTSRRSIDTPIGRSACKAMLTHTAHVRELWEDDRNASTNSTALSCIDGASHEQASKESV
jgi:hypothetical protein